MDHARAEPVRRVCYLPVAVPEGTGGDAVGVTAEHGRRLMRALPRPGAVYAVDGWWWWIVPAESQVGLDWPVTTRYWPGACRPRAAALPGPGRLAPRLIHRPATGAPFTHPLLLYIAACRLAGVPPVAPHSPRQATAHRP